MGKYTIVTINVPFYYIEENGIRVSTVSYRIKEEAEEECKRLIDEDKRMEQAAL